MTEQEIIDSLNELVEMGTSRRKIEQHLNMPINQLSGVMNGKKRFPAKWKAKLEFYITAAKFANDAYKEQVEALLNSPVYAQAKKEAFTDLVDKGVAITLTTRDKTERIDPFSPEGEKVMNQAAEEFMGQPIPEGLSGLKLAVWKNDIKVKAKNKKYG
jgi:hypothetical protein